MGGAVLSITTILVTRYDATPEECDAVWRRLVTKQVPEMPSQFLRQIEETLEQVRANDRHVGGKR